MNSAEGEESAWKYQSAQRNGGVPIHDHYQKKPEGGAIIGGSMWMFIFRVAFFVMQGKTLAWHFLSLLVWPRWTTSATLQAAPDRLPLAGDGG